MRLVAAVAVVAFCMAPAFATAPLLKRIDVLDDGLVVRLHLSSPVPSTAHSLPAGGTTPPRIYIDLTGTALAPMTARLTSGRGELLRVRAGQYDPETIRVVLDLARALPYDVEHDEDTITVTLRPPGEPSPPLEEPAAGTGSEEAAPVLRQKPPDVPVPAARAAPRRAARPPDPAPTSAQAPLIVLDAGHGGRDPGAEGVGGVREKDVVLQLAHELAARLTARLPVDVILTRNDDTFVPIGRRLALPRERATLFISLHANACSDPSASGFEVFYGGGALRDAAVTGMDRRAALLGRCLGRALDDRLGGMRGVARPGGFHVLVKNPVPSALVEVGYLTHPQEAARFGEPEYRRRLEDALVEGVAQFLRASAPPL